MNRRIYVDVTKCVGCRSCELACAVAHSQSKDLWQAILETPQPQARLEVGMVDTYRVPLHCRHCEDAPCVQVCPSHAMTRSGPEDPVVCETSRCIGCTLCVLACPFGVLAMDRTGKAIVKCDLCRELLEMGHDPACVTACPTHAIRFLTAAEYSRDVAVRARAEIVTAIRSAEKIKDQ